MLLSLNLKNFVIVDKLMLEFGNGLSVFTGETGAGKSIVMDALGLLLGDRADPAQVRHGEDKADLLAEFDLGQRPQAQQWLAENDLAGDDVQHAIIRRSLDTQGKSRAFINGTPATLAQLKALGEMLVDIHGQHAHQQLLKAENQRALLDHFAGATAQVGKVAQQWQHWRAVQDELAAAQRDASTFEAERERLLFQIEEVSGLALGEQEWPELQAEHKRLQHAASLIDGVQLALTSLADGDENCQSWLGSAAHKLQTLGEYDDQLAPALQLLDGVEAQLSEAVSELRRYADHLELDPSRLADVETRLDAIWRMARKYRAEPDQLPDLLQGWETRLEALGGSEGLARLQHAEKAAAEAWQKEAATLSKLRQQHAGKLAKAVTTEMKPLALADSRFEIELEAAAPGPHGAETVDFRVAHANTPARPMGKIVSGGELSRISLAIQVIVSELSGVGTLVFDEVDVGIGGRVAEIVGRMLADLAQQRQVLCITHLPQVAACGQHHYQVSKARAGQSMVSHVTELDQAARVEEIARMLGGVEITDTTRRHAAELLGHA